jgi:hypothetical protein
VRLERGDGEVATQALIQAGHRRIGFVNGPVDYFPASPGRLTGYRRALESVGIPFDGDLVRPGDWWQETGTRHTADLLSLKDPPTAIFCGNGWMAMGAYDAVKEAGLRIPDDVAVLGFDNRVEIADHMRPALAPWPCPTTRWGQSRRGSARPAAGGRGGHRADHLSARPARIDLTQTGRSLRVLEPERLSEPAAKPATCPCALHNLGL